MNVVSALIIAAGIALAGFLAGGLYAGVQTNIPTGHDSVFVVNKLTGTTYHCSVFRCHPMQFPPFSD